MIKKIVVIGANEYQQRLVQRAKELGFETHVFAWAKGAVAREIADHFYPVSITDKEKILEIAKKIKPSGVCSIATDLAVPTVSYIAQELGLVANSIRSSQLSTDKYLMRQVFWKNNIQCPRFQLIRKSNEIDSEKIHLPAIVKPTDRSGSRGIFRVDTFADVGQIIKQAQSVSFSDFVLIEEFIEGEEFSVEGFSQDGEHHILQITKKYTSGAPRFIESAHFSPASVSSSLRERIEILVKKALESLGIVTGASHTEVKVDPHDKVFVIEVGARMGGDFIGSDMVKYTTGIDYVENVIRCSIGERFSVGSVRAISSSIVKFLFTEKDIDTFELIRRKYPEIIMDHSLEIEPREVITDSSERNGYYIMKIDNLRVCNQVKSLLGLSNNE